MNYYGPMLSYKSELFQVVAIRIAIFNEEFQVMYKALIKLLRREQL